MKKGAHPADPRGLILEAYNIEDLSEKDCRTIFLDWALGVPAESDMARLMSELAGHYVDLNPEHPMSMLLNENTGSTKNVRSLRGRFSKRKGQGKVLIGADAHSAFQVPLRSRLRIRKASAGTATFNQGKKQVIQFVPDSEIQAFGPWIPTLAPSIWSSRAGAL